MLCWLFCLVVGLSGLEPLTSRLSGVRSNQLSYRPVFSSVFNSLSLCCRDALFLQIQRGLLTLYGMVPFIATG